MVLLPTEILGIKSGTIQLASEKIVKSGPPEMVNAKSLGTATELPEASTVRATTGPEQTPAVTLDEPDKMICEAGVKTGAL